MEILKDADLSLSAQVLQEFYHQATRSRGRLAMTHEQALAFLSPLMELPIQPVTRELFTTATGMADRHGISYWDAAILAAAKILGLRRSVLGVDMSHRSRTLRRGSSHKSLCGRNPDGVRPHRPTMTGRQRLPAAALRGR